MSKKKGKFDLTQLVHDGHVKEGQFLAFVSDPKKTAVVTKMLNGEYKFKVGPALHTVHGYATELLGMEPPGHASKWFRNDKGETLYDLWQKSIEERKAA